MTDTQRARELLACPFCGGEAEVFLNTKLPGMHTILCRGQGCGARGPHRHDEEALAPAWNTRATLPGREGIAAAAYRVLRNWKLGTMAQEDEPSEGYPLVDAVSTPDTDIGTGEEELRDIAFEIAAAIRALNSGAGR